MKPNILFITTDQQRYDTLGCAGNPIIQTPNLDSLASGGIRFDRCFVQSPLCGPSRAVLLTCRYPSVTGALSNGYSFRDDEQTWPSLLSDFGYATAGVGKMHFEPWDVLHGFGERIIADSKFFDSYEDDYARFLKSHGYSSNRILPERKKARENSWAVGPQLPEELYIDTFIGRESCRWIEKHAEKPFALQVSFCSPHTPYDPPQPFDTLYQDSVFPPRVFSEHEYASKPPELKFLNRRYPTISDNAVRQKVWQYYYGLISLVDKQVGAIVDTLRRCGLLDRTLIIFTSDHGDGLGDHGFIDKAFAFYEPIVRVPAFLYYPSRFRPGVSNALIETIDLTATMLTLVGVNMPITMQGRSLIDLLESRTESVREDVFSEHRYIRMIRTERYKLVYYQGQEYGELYDLQEDANELNNLWKVPEWYPKKLELLARLLDRLIDNTNSAFQMDDPPTNQGIWTAMVNPPIEVIDPESSLLNLKKGACN